MHAYTRRCGLLAWFMARIADNPGQSDGVYVQAPIGSNNSDIIPVRWLSAGDFPGHSMETFECRLL